MSYVKQENNCAEEDTTRRMDHVVKRENNCTGNNTPRKMDCAVKQENICAEEGATRSMDNMVQRENYAKDDTAIRVDCVVKQEYNCAEEDATGGTTDCAVKQENNCTEGETAERMYCVVKLENNYAEEDTGGRNLDQERIDRGTPELLFECHMCCERFRNKIDIMEHMSQHQCQTCFETVVDLKDHVCLVYNCSVCVFKCQNEHDMKAHFETMHMGDGYPYISSGKTSVLEMELNYGTVYDCKGLPSVVSTMCGHIGEDLQTCNRHARQKHHESNFVPPTYQECVMTQQSLERHAERYKYKKESCPICAKIFDATYIMRHMQVHSSEKPFTCEICNKAFKRKSNVQQHMLVHTGKKQFSCSVCTKAFRQKSYVQQHMRVHTGEKPFACSVCTMTFGQKYYLNRHMRIHLGKKPFTCKTCYKRFRSKANLRLHMRVHTDEKPFECPTCGKMFKYRSAMQLHTRVHSDEKPFICPFCSRGFKYNFVMLRHTWKMHGQKRYSRKRGNSGRRQLLRRADLQAARDQQQRLDVRDDPEPLSSYTPTVCSLACDESGDKTVAEHLIGA